MYRYLINILIFSLIFVGYLLANEKIITESYNTQKSENKQHQEKKEFEYFLVKFDRLNVMDSPSSFANVLGTLARGDTVKSIGYTISANQYDVVSKLIKFSYKNKIGYVNSLYLQKIIIDPSAKPEFNEVSVYTSVLLVSAVMFLGLLAN